MLTESDLLTPEWLAALASGHSVLVRGLVGFHRLDSLQALLPRGVLAWAPLDVPAGEALDAAFFEALMPGVLGAVPRKVYALPAVTPASVNPLAELCAGRPWVQWVAVVPDPEVTPLLPDGALLFDAKYRGFPDAAAIPPHALAWARRVLGGARSADEASRRVSAEGPRLLTAVNAVMAGEFDGLAAALGPCDDEYLAQVLALACELAGLERENILALAAEVRQAQDVQGMGLAEGPAPIQSPPEPARLPSPPPQVVPKAKVPPPALFEGGKALPIYPPGDAAGKHARELDLVRRDAGAHTALLEMLRDLHCESATACPQECHDPAQKWACLRDNAWAGGIPTAVVDQWLEIFAAYAQKAGRQPGEAHASFCAIARDLNAPLPTFGEGAFAAPVGGESAPPASATSAAFPLPPPSARITRPRDVPKPAAPPQPPRKASPPKTPSSLTGRQAAILQSLAALERRVAALTANVALSVPPPAMQFRVPPALPASPASAKVEDEGTLEEQIARLMDG